MYGLKIIIYLTAIYLFYKYLISRLETKPTPLNYSIFLIIYSIFYTFLFEINNGCFLWPHVLDQALVMKILNPNILLNDFTINALTTTPKVVFGKFILLFNLLSIKPSFVFQYLDCIGQFFGASLFYSLVIKVLKKWKTNDKDFSLMTYFVFSIVFFEYNFKVLNNLLSFSYFDSFFSFKHLSYSTNFSLFIGILFLFLYSKKNRYSIFFFIISLVINPLIGIFIFGFWVIYLFSYRDGITSLIVCFCLISILSISFLLIFNKNLISTQDFIRIYIYSHQPDHYVISKGINFQFFYILFLHLLPFFLTIPKKMKLTFLFSFIFIFGSLFLQYLFIEVFPTKIFAKATPSRVVVFNFIILLINYCTIFLFYFQKRQKFFNHNFNQNDISRTIIIQKTLSSKVFKNIFFLFIILFSILLTNYRNKTTPKRYILDHDKVEKWISQNTGLNEVFQTFPATDPKLNFYFRIFLKRAIYWGVEFPLFNESNFILWEKRRQQLFRPLDKIDLTAFINKVDYAVIPNSFLESNEKGKIFKNLEPLPYKKFRHFTIFELNNNIRN